jgi:AraC-like DNA-binding protein
MELYRDRGVLAGFRYERPVESLRYLTHCGDAICSPSHATARHRHATFEFTYLLRGNLKVAVNGRSIQQPPLSVFIARPNQWHGWNAFDHPEFHQMWIGLDLHGMGKDATELAKRIEDNKLTVLPASSAIEATFRGIIAQIVQRAEGFEQVVDRQSELLVCLLNQTINKQLSPRDTGRVVIHDYATETAIRLMRENLNRRLTLSELAHVGGYSKSRFSAKFRQDVGSPPIQYHLQLRLEAARNALAMPNATVTSVATAYGFSSSQHFSTAFLGAFKTTPRRWMLTRAL